MNKVIPALVGFAALSSSAFSQALMFDFGPITSTGGNLSLSPYHSVAPSTGTTWNVVGNSTGFNITNGVPDPTSSFSYSDTTSASGISLNLGAGSTTGTNANTLLLGAQPTTSNGLGGTITRSSTSIYGTTISYTPTSGGSALNVAGGVASDGIFNAGSNTLVGFQVKGLAAGTYDVYVTARNTSAAEGNAAYTQTVYAAAGTNDVDFTYSASGSSSESITYASGSLATQDTSAWVEGENYVKISVSITAGQALDIAVGSTGSETRGFLNTVQIVSVIPEPSSFAAIAGLGMLGFAATRRRRSA